MDEFDPKSKFSAGSEVLQRLFEDGKSPLSGPFTRWKLWMKWGDYVGPTIASQTEPVGLHRGTLYVWVRNSAWMQQMVFMKDEIQQTLNKKLGSSLVKNIRFTLDRRELPSDSEEQNRLRRTLTKLGSGDE